MNQLFAYLLKRYSSPLGCDCTRHCGLHTMNPEFVVFLWAEQDTYSVSVSLEIAVWIFFSHMP